MLQKQPNAGAQARLAAGATQERTLEAVACSALFGLRRGQYPASLFLLQQ
jgi:hypothetical protein